MSDMNGEVQEMGKGHPDDQPVEVPVVVVDVEVVDDGQS